MGINNYELILYVYSGNTYDEIANMLNVSSQEVKLKAKELQIHKDYKEIQEKMKFSLKKWIKALIP